ncbi:MAG: hypothetical protein G8D81_00160 [gamma proteobacterium symbiont of Clathrolucina costata]|uniref:Uncharacterized protein n=1 Tax=Candidatus Thiodiazotropha taylori TaxID=2792791 RepID=A0A9E4NNY4_9GAMM|nr:hypothetical protein [Candidatus Thiodiazotropha taylori]MCW4239195.1 hypothetical protein [Candidatus Thiodiazotropha endolucinida]
MTEIFEKLIDEALSKAKHLNIFTFAIYHDHESGFVSICIDTKENSDKKVIESNKCSMKHFKRVINEGSIEEAMLWQANIGRNLSLGDFEAVNIVEYELNNTKVEDSFYLNMVKAANNKAASILKQSAHGASLVFCCSTAHEEVGLTWVQENA